MKLLLLLLLSIALCSSFTYDHLSAFCRQKGTKICLKNIRYTSGKNEIKYEPVSCLKKQCPRGAYCDKTSSCIEEVQSSQTSSDKLTCVRSVFKDTMNNLTVFSNDQLESFQNISPEVKKKVKTAIMDILSSLGLVLEVSTVPTVSLAMLPVYLLRAKNLIILLERDLENLKPESDSLSTSLEPIKKGVMAVVQNMPMKAAKCFYNSELIPHHAADRVRGRASNYETPKKQRTPAKLPRSTPRLTGPTPRTTARATRLGIVNQDPMPASLPMGATREFVEFRTRRKERNAARLAKEPVPTLIPGGVNPFDTENLKKYVRKMYRAIDATVWTTNTPVKPGKVRFREDHEETLAVDQTQRTIMVIDEDEDEEEEVEQNSTIVLDDD